MPEYDKEAAAERQKARTKELTDKLEAGMKELYNSDKYKNYLKSMSNFYQYSSRNIMLIHQQMPNATKVANYKLWTEKFERHVKKGESGLYIYAPIAVKEPETKLMEKLDPETGAPLLDENGKVIMEEMTALSNMPRFKLVPVFDVSQTYGDPLPELVENISGDVAQYTAFIDTLKTVSPLPIEFEPMQENQDGYCDFGNKIGIRDNMSQTQTVCATIHEMAHARLHDRQNVAENAEPKTKRAREIEAESVAYVICQHYGIETSPNSFGYLAEYGNRDMSELKASLDTIRKESNSLITAIDERFSIICKERGIDLTAKEPENEEKQPVGYLYFVSSDEKIPYYSDNDIVEAYKKEFDSLGIWGVRFQDVTDDALMKKLCRVNSDQFGEMPEQEQDSFRDNDKISFYTLNIDNNSVPSFYDNHIDAVEAYLSAPPLDGRVLGFCGDGIDLYTFAQRDGGIDRIMRDNFPLRANDGRYHELLDSLRDIERRLGAAALENVLTNSDGTQNNPFPPSQEEQQKYEGILPDTAIGILNMNLYGYTAEGMLPLTEDRAIELFNNDLTVYLLYHDNTEAMAYDVYEIKTHDGMLGIDRDEWLNSKEYAKLLAQNNELKKEQAQAVQTTEQPETDYNVTPSPAIPEPPPPEILPNEIPVYKFDGKTARDNGEINIYRQSYNLNVECGEAIDAAILNNTKYGEMAGTQYVDTKTAVKSVIQEYGVDRVAWVLAANINHHDWDGRLSKDNKAWAKEFDTTQPDYHIKTHLTILDSIFNRFREVIKEKPSLLDTLEKNEQKSKQQFSQTPDINKDKPKIKKDGEEL